MADHRELSYETMVERALRGVLRESLELVAEQGLPGKHYFYITFHSGFAGVEMPTRLREEYPDEMTIVLQHQFWNLDVQDDRFSVSLSFDNKPEQLVVPFESIITFADPSVEFVLQFETLSKEAEPEDERRGRTPSTAQANASPSEDDQGDLAEDDSAQVFTLDSFRRK